MGGDGTIDLALAGPGDVAEVAGLLVDIELHYRGFCADPDPVERMAERIADPIAGTRYLLARRGGASVGIACFAVFHIGIDFTGVLFLKDLFVRAEARNAGVGEALFKGLAALARDHGVARIDLTAERRSPAALRFYERLGGRVIDEKIFLRFEGEAFEALAGQRDAASR